MNNLYNSLAEVYEAMYKTFINYKDEFDLYKGVLQKYNCTSLVEIGCGTGNLAGPFTNAGFNYTGIDISDEMLNIAQKNNPSVNFIQSAMQDFTLAAPVAAAIITGRTISYVLTNKDMMDALLAISKNLQQPGILCFDFIDASKFIPQINSECVVHTASFDNRNFIRESFWGINYSQSWSFDWRSVFYEEQPGGDKQKIGEDNSTIRAFTRDEIMLFLQLASFNIVEITARGAYAFDTFFVVAQKKTTF